MIMEMGKKLIGKGVFVCVCFLFRCERSENWR